MNWYRLSYNFIPMDNYLMVGHKPDECQTYMWAWLDNQLKVIELDQSSKDLTHGGWIESTDGFRGRAEICENQNPKISLVRPFFNGVSSKVPSVLIRTLTSRFGQDSEIYFS